MNHYLNRNITNNIKSLKHLKLKKKLKLHIPVLWSSTLKLHVRYAENSGSGSSSIAKKGIANISNFAVYYAFHPFTVLFVNLIHVLINALNSEYKIIFKTDKYCRNHSFIFYIYCNFLFIREVFFISA